MKYLGFDSSYFCWRAFHTTGSLSFEGQPTGVIHGFLISIIMQVRQFGINQPLFFWDSKESKRKDLFAGYKDRYSNITEDEKADREEVYIQMQQLRDEVLPIMGFINNFIQTGYEADDLIGRFAKDNPGTMVMLTNDDDMLQLADDAVWYSPQRKTKFNEIALRKKYGIGPKDWVRVKQIAGCNSDTVPGVKGVGVPTAIKYLTGQMNPDTKTYRKITGSKGLWLQKRNKPLVALPFEGTKEVEVKVDTFNPDGFLAVCDMYGFKKLAGELGEWENYFRG